jgi:hypothetical protein
MDRTCPLFFLDPSRARGSSLSFFSIFYLHEKMSYSLKRNKVVYFTVVFSQRTHETTVRALGTLLGRSNDTTVQPERKPAFARPSGATTSATAPAAKRNTITDSSTASERCKCSSFLLGVSTLRTPTLDDTFKTFAKDDGRKFVLEPMFEILELAAISGLALLVVPRVVVGVRGGGANDDLKQAPIRVSLHLTPMKLGLFRRCDRERSLRGSSSLTHSTINYLEL